MKTLLQSPLGRFRLVSMAEGTSFALLLFVAMPLKYGLGLPLMVRVIGMTHGLLFVTFGVTLFAAMQDRAWPPSRAAKLLGASLVPLGAIWIERTCAAELSGAAELP